MNKKRVVKYIGITIALVVIIAFIYSIVNYNTIKQEVTGAVETGGLIVYFVFAFILESIPNIIGLEPVVLTALIAGFKIRYIYILALIAVVFSNLFSFFIGYKASNYAKGFIDKKNIKKYDELWHKYGKITMIITAVSPVPYIPAIAGIFKMKPSYFAFVIMPFRLIRHAVVFTVLILLFA
jgi:membrane protein YqaA with SNARE-associated domain